MWGFKSELEHLGKLPQSIANLDNHNYLILYLYKRAYNGPGNWLV